MVDESGILIIAAVLIGLWSFRWRWAAGALPPELKTARLIYAERVFRSRGSITLTAKLDRAYRVGTGPLILVELKTRRSHRAYPSDVIELSAQRVAVQAQTGERVAEYAYVLVERPSGRKAGWYRVDLMAPADVVALALRREALLAGLIEPRCARSIWICQDCVFWPECRLLQN
ncbi:MAG: hypothetical protein EKK46_15910 [Rhodocyclaceae bacterium]|nr:MAG: hypothetical protein EKK46_15910 [Rhodocyclaceae bacterium]